MSKIGRNDLCPCGSGQKYKKCCLAKDNSTASRRRDEEQAISKALSWLEERYPEELAAAIYYDFMDEPDDERKEAIDALPPNLGQVVAINIGEWLLADAELHINGKEIKAHELILEKGGPLLSAHGREWIQELAKRPLSLYEVKEVIKDEGLVLVDMLKPDQPPIQVREKVASGYLTPWDTFGTRLVWQDDSFIMSGALYRLDRETALECLSEISSELKHEGDDPEIVRYIRSCTIIDYWFTSILEKKPFPNLVDMATGERILQTTDHYQVSDWQEFEQILAAQDDVEGDRAEGWNRFVKLDDGLSRYLASITPKGSDSFEIFCRTTQLANEAREWLESIAGRIIKYKIREVVDPRSEKARNAAKPLPESDIPKDLQRQIIHQYLAGHYET